MSDLISRQMAIRAIMDLPNCNNGYSDAYDKFYIISILEDLPPVERKNGVWLLDPPEGTNQLFKCSVCGYHWAYWWASVMTPERMAKTVRSCPNCFAEMRY